MRNIELNECINVGNKNNCRCGYQYKRNKFLQSF